MKKLAVFVLLLLALSAYPVYAVTVYYQPTPYPATKSDGTPMPQDINIVHVLEGWLPSYYYGRTLQRDGKLQVGGWGDQYRAYIKFDLTGLPQKVDSAILWLMPYSRGDASSPIPYASCSVASEWDTSLTWSTQPSFSACYGYYPAPVAGRWSGSWLSGGGPNWYNSWQNGTLHNNGVMLFPQAVNNNFDVFFSTAYNNYATDPYADSRRPILQLNFTPTLELKMPLPGNHAWLVTTEMGGYDCKGAYDQYHDGSNYFSIDFSWKNVADSGATVYPNPDPNLNRQNNGVYIPVIATAGGKVKFAGNDRDNPDNGYYVVIDHDGDGDVGTGFQTRYLHLQPPGPTVVTGSTIVQGQTIGYMGNTGLSDGAHLHFGVRYKDNGAKTVPELAKVVMDGLVLKSFQTECSGGTWNRYYRSGNRVY